MSEQTSPASSAPDMPPPNRAERRAMVRYYNTAHLYNQGRRDANALHGAEVAALNAVSGYMHRWLGDRIEAAMLDATDGDGNSRDREDRP